MEDYTLLERSGKLVFIQVLSDIHVDLEHTKLPKISAKADVLAFAGDVGGNLDKVLAYFLGVREQTSAPIVYILGNREYYDKVFHGCYREYLNYLSKIPNFHVLDKSSVNIGGIYFLGSTLWVDFDDSRNLYMSSDAYNDFSRMKNLNKFCGVTTITLNDIMIEHNECKDALIREFKSFKGKDSVVLTHHCPSYFCAPERDLGNLFLSFYYVELSNLIITYRPKAWLFGHTHRSCKKMIGGTLMASNPWGYPHEGYGEYEEEYLIEV